MRAVSLLPPTYSLLLVGDGPLLPELERLASDLGIADRTAFVGVLDNPFPLMRQVDVVVLSSVEEGFGLVALEAAALGVPFVGSACGGLGEICRLLQHPTFRPGDPSSLASVIVELTTGVTHSVPSQVLDRFDVTRVARTYLSLATCALPRSAVRLTGAVRRTT
jgi:glycosyltransferase involved in cell wall biosynthesis